MKDPYKLQRFVEAQEDVYDLVCSELRRGRKSSHWMWFIFPQVQGLGQSTMAKRYAIHSPTEAEAYLEHPILGPRLCECCELLLQIEGRQITDIMGYPDDLKLRSSMTLFSQATANNSRFLRVLQKYFDGDPDETTLKLLKV